MPWIHWRAASIWRQVGRADLDHALIVDVDLGAGRRDDLADDLAAGADDLADLVLGHRHRLDPRRVGELLAGVVERLGHFAEDMRAAVLRLGEGDLHDLLGDSGDLDVHLQRGDAFASAGDLEVHVAQMILVAEDVADDGKILAFEDQAHGDSGDRRFNGTPASIIASEPPQTVAIDDEPLLSVMSERTRIV